jgi:hypothetical protein
LSQGSCPGLEGALLQRKTTALINLLGSNEIIAISLAGNTMLADLRELGQGVFEVPADTRLLFFDKDRVKTCSIGSLTSSYSQRAQNGGIRPEQGMWKLHIGASTSSGFPASKVHGERGDAKPENLVDSPDPKHSKGDTTAERPIIGGTLVGPTMSSSQECVLTKHHPIGVFSANVEARNNIFHRDEYSPKEKQRMAFTTAAVVRAACGLKKARTKPGFMVFKICRGPFAFPWKVSVGVGEYMYVGTNRGHFAPRP